MEVDTFTLIKLSLFSGIMLEALAPYTFIHAGDHGLATANTQAALATYIIMAAVGAFCILAAGIVIGGIQHLACAALLAVGFFTYMLNNMALLSNNAHFMIATKWLATILMSGAAAVFVREQPVYTGIAIVSAVMAAALPQTAPEDNFTNPQSTYSLAVLSGAITAMSFIITPRLR